MIGSSSAIELAERAGIDIGLLDDNLRLSFEQRALQHQAALDLALAIECAGRQLRERTTEAAAAAR
jgi:hypothetical protein